MTSQKNPFLSVRFRLGLLLLLGVLVLGGIFWKASSQNHYQSDRLYSNQVRSRQLIFDSFITSISAPLETFAYDYTYWDDMVNFVETGDPVFAELNIVASMETYKTNVVWAYSADGNLVYSYDNFGDEDPFDPALSTPITSQQLPEFFKENGVFKFYSKIDNRLFEIYGATIHPTDDATRQTPARGYLFVAKHLDETYLTELGEAIEGQAEIVDPLPLPAGNAGSFDKNNGEITLRQDLNDLTGQPISVLRGKYVAADIKGVVKTQENLLRLGIALLIVLSAILFYAVLRWVMAPLRSVTKALNSQDDKFISRLKHKHDEFGDIARLIEKSFGQQKLLQEQKALVEQEVAERTKELSHEHIRLLSSINSLETGFLMTSKNGEIAMHNSALAELFGYNAAIGTLSIKQLDDSLKGFNLTKAVKKCFASGQPFHEDQIPLDSRIISIAGVPIKPGQDEIIGCVVMISDVTEAKVLERSKDEFFSIASHELRTPLTTIKGNSSMIMQYYADTVKDPSLKEMISDIHTSSGQLIEIVNDFLNLSKLEQGRMVFKFDELALEEIVENVVYESKTIAQDKKLDLQFIKPAEPLPKIWADAGRVKEIIFNLVGNAIKYTEKGTIELGVTADSKNATLTITDTGRGISLENQKMLFHKFQQAGDSLLTRDNTKGTGLGLYISKMIAENLGGTVALTKSAVDKGSTFILTLPIATPELKKANPKNKALDTDTGMTEE